MVVVGVLALQGASQAHCDVFAKLQIPAREVRAPGALSGLTHLVIPGGESTTLARLLDLFGLRNPIVERHRAGELSLFGTCAGAILLGRDDGEAPVRMGLANVGVARNAYGRQVDSFTGSVDLTFGNPVQGSFIRAPRLKQLGPGVEVLGRCGSEPVLVRDNQVLLAAYHPELGSDLAVHRFFIEAFECRSPGESDHNHVSPLRDRAALGPAPHGDGVVSCSSVSSLGNRVDVIDGAEEK